MTGMPRIKSETIENDDLGTLVKNYHTYVNPLDPKKETARILREGGYNANQEMEIINFRDDYSPNGTLSVIGSYRISDEGRIKDYTIKKSEEFEYDPSQLVLSSELKLENAPNQTIYVYPQFANPLERLVNGKDTHMKTIGEVNGYTLVFFTFNKSPRDLNQPTRDYFLNSNSQYESRLKHAAKNHILPVNHGIIAVKYEDNRGNKKWKE